MIPLAHGKTLRTLNIIDDFNREVLSITVDTSLPSQRVIRGLETLIEWRGMGLYTTYKPIQNNLIERLTEPLNKTLWIAICLKS